MQGDMQQKNRLTPPKGSTLIGVVKVRTLSGLSAEAISYLIQTYEHRLISEGGQFVQRECGSYVTGATYSIDASLFDIAEELKDLQNQGVEIGATKSSYSQGMGLMIGGPFLQLEVEVQFPQLLFHFGFRGFDWTLFQQKLGPGPFNGQRTLPFDFVIPAFDSGDVATIKGAIQEVKEYSSAELYKPLSKVTVT